MNVSVKDALDFGLKSVLKNWRLVLLVYFMNLCFGLLVALPIMTLFVRDVSHSLVAKHLSEGFEYRWYIEFVSANSNFFRALTPEIILILILYAVFDMFLAGGLIVVLSKRSQSKIHDVFVHGASNFWGFLFVSLIHVALIVLLYKLNNIWAEEIDRAAMSTLNEYVILRTNLWRYATVLIFLAVSVIMSDFSRVGIALDSEKNLFLKAFRGLTFVIKHPIQIVGIYFALLVVLAGLAAAYFYAGFHLHSGKAGEIFVGIIVGQLFILLRAAIKLLFYSADGFFYINVQTEVIRVTREMLE